MSKIFFYLPNKGKTNGYVVTQKPHCKLTIEEIWNAIKKLPRVREWLYRNDVHIGMRYGREYAIDNSNVLTFTADGKLNLLSECGGDDERAVAIVVISVNWDGVL